MWGTWTGTHPYIEPVITIMLTLLRYVLLLNVRFIGMHTQGVKKHPMSFGRNLKRRKLCFLKSSVILPSQRRIRRGQAFITDKKLSQPLWSVWHCVKMNYFNLCNSNSVFHWVVSIYPVYTLPCQFGAMQTKQELLVDDINQLRRLLRSALLVFGSKLFILWF